MGRFLVSGIGPYHDGGVGRLMRHLVREYATLGYTIIYRRDKKPLRLFDSRWGPVLKLVELSCRAMDSMRFSILCYRLVDSEVVFLHPQTAGFQNLFRIVRKNRVSIYVMDCSFFCIRSYNTHPLKKKECLQCLGSISPDADCDVRPGTISVKKNVEHLERFHALSGRLKFLVQNNLQKQLLLKHFGENIVVEIVGLETGELVECRFATREELIQGGCDVVFHGAPVDAKGVSYFVEIAALVPEFSFFVPSESSVVLAATNRSTLPENLVCTAVTWEAGLMQYVKTARLVMNPSMWSAPIEGALLKSAACNPNVATVESRYGYEGEFDGIENHLRLSEDPLHGAAHVRKFLENKKLC